MDKFIDLVAGRSVLKSEVTDTEKISSFIHLYCKQKENEQQQNCDRYGKAE